jgi:serine/threonine-protein kinase
MSTEWKKDGEPVPQYRLIEDRPFARGGAGEVWRAAGPGGVKVVLKRVMLNSPLGDAERKALELVRSISGHPHLLSVHGFWLQDESLVIAAEQASGSLASRLRTLGGRGIPTDELLSHMEDAAKGIDFLNSPVHLLEGKQVAVQHRDVKPDNLLLVGGSVKVSDFGLAKALERQTSSHSGVMTPAYAAPEYFQSATTSRSDQYSLAATYVELRTGHCIFSGTAAQMMHGHLHRSPDLSGLAPAEAAVVGRALAKDPAERFATCGEFVRAVRSAVHQPPLSTSASPSAQQASAAAAHGGPESHRGGAAAAVAVDPSAPTIIPAARGAGPAARETAAVDRATQETTPVKNDPAAAPRRTGAGLMFFCGVAATIVAAVVWVRFFAPTTWQTQPAAPSTTQAQLAEATTPTTAAAPPLAADAAKVDTDERPKASEATEPPKSDQPTEAPLADDLSKAKTADAAPPAETQEAAAKKPTQEPDRPAETETTAAKQTEATESTTATKSPPAEVPTDSTPPTTQKSQPRDETTQSEVAKTQKSVELPEPVTPEPDFTKAEQPGEKTASKTPGGGSKPTDDKPAEPQPPAQAQAPAGSVAEQGYTFFKKYCYRCHGVEFKVPTFNVLDRDVLVASRGDDPAYVVPGNLDDSLVWQRVALDADMPPSGAKPTDAEKDILKKWIEAGAPFPAALAAEREFRSDADVLTAIRGHLRKTPMADRQFQRYFTLTHLHNNTAVRDDEMRLYRAALAKMVNSLSWKHDVVVPAAVDDAGAIFNVDLRELGWDEQNLWKEILKVYPYGLKHSQHRDVAMRDVAQEVYHLSGSDLPYLRADWFIATAARPPLYHTMLMLPKTAGELERLLKVDVENDFLKNRLVRAGFATSGVSSHNRLADRHAGVHGAYWKSYDFGSSEGRGNIFRFPLGPTFTRNPFPDQAFEHAGGEIIFSLPNGLQGYLLVDGNGARIDAGPEEIVSDELKTTGTPTIVTGLSCMACHKHGMIRFKDTLRDALGVGGEAREKIEEIVPNQESMDKIVVRDEEQFLQALERATGGFLKVAEDKGKGIREFPEPVGAIARLFVKDMGPDEVAFELGIADMKQLQTVIQANPNLRRLGLGPLVQGQKIKRQAWESLKAFNSPFQEAARELELGTPMRVF